MASTKKERLMRQRRARALAKEGLTYQQISERMAKEGIYGTRNGKPLNVSTISHLINKPVIRRERKAARSKTSTTTKKAKAQISVVERALSAIDYQRFSALSCVLQDDGIDDQDKVRICRLVLGVKE
jgi:hypothetical protein